MGTVIELITKETVTVEEDMLVVYKEIQENQFVTLKKRRSPHTVIINREAIALIKASVD